MEQEKLKQTPTGRRVGWIAALGSAMALLFVLSVGIAGRNASSSRAQAAGLRPQKAVVIEATRAAEASDVAAQADPGQEKRVPGHSECDLQLD